MRQIKFRGEDRKSGKLVTGDLLQPRHKYERVPTIRSGWSDYFEVKPDSVAQLIAVDTNDKEVYEGDLVKAAGASYPATFKDYTDILHGITFLAKRDLKWNTKSAKMDKSPT